MERKRDERVWEHDDNVHALDAADLVPALLALEPLERRTDARAARAADEEALGADQALASRERERVGRLDPVRDGVVREDGGDLRAGKRVSSCKGASGLESEERDAQSRSRCPQPARGGEEGVSEAFKVKCEEDRALGRTL